MTRFPLALPAAFLLLAACGGSTTSRQTVEPACSGVAGCPESDDADGGKGADDGKDADGCSTEKARGLVACVPGTAPSELPITIDVRLDGCFGCYTSTESCDVQVAGQVVTLGFATKQCIPPGDSACPPVCEEGKATCTIPPLPSGTYQIVLEGEPAQAGLSPLPPRQLVLEDKRGGQTACTVPPVGTPIPDLSVDGFSTACVQDTDCAVVRTGKACTPCACPNSAIARGALPTFEARAREATALCERPANPPVCAGCPPTAAACVAGTCTVVNAL